MVDLDTPAGIEHVVKVIKLTKWCNTSSVVMYVYELMITLDEEVNLIWNGVFSPGKALFLLLRYLTLASLLFIITIFNLPEVSSQMFVARESSQHSPLTIDLWLTRDYSIGRVWIRFQWIAGSLIGLMAHLTLELRLYAMFNKSKKILILLVVGTTAVAGCMFGLLIEILQEEEVEFINLGEAPELHMCVKTNVPYLVRIFWIPILAGEALLVSLAVYKGLQTQIQLPTQNEWWSERAPYGFLRFLVRDSVLFFLMVSAPFLATELVWVIAGSDYIEVPVGFAIASSSIWSQRLLLNIRKHRQGPVEELHVTVDSDIPEFSNRDIVLETFRSMKTER
ncbi:hypothetical protein ACEPAF_4527 [Sanghuangporus sanghuang]